MSLPGRATAGLLVLMTALLWQRPLAAAPVPVRVPERSLHGFLVLSTPEEVLIASGDRLLVGRDGEVESRLEFHFKDGPVFAGPISDEKVQDEGAGAQFEKRGWKIQENAENVLF